MNSMHCPAEKRRLPPSSYFATHQSLTAALLPLLIATIIASASALSPKETDSPPPPIEPLLTYTSSPFAAPPKGKREPSMLVIVNEDGGGGRGGTEGGTEPGTGTTGLEEQFQEFLASFDIQLNAENVDFMSGDGLHTLLRQADNPKYATVLFVLNSNDSRDVGYCDMAEPMSLAFNKTIILWPCPKMKRTERFLPSYETISFAVKSISQEFNWTEAVIFVAGTNWGLPLAIAANLHVPYRIEFNYDEASKSQLKDKSGTVLIVTSPLNSGETKRLLADFQHLSYTKVLLIDIIGSIFSNRNQFSGYLNTKQELDYIFEHWSENDYYSTATGRFIQNIHGNATTTADGGGGKQRKARNSGASADTDSDATELGGEPFNSHQGVPLVNEDFNQLPNLEKNQSLRKNRRTEKVKSKGSPSKGSADNDDVDSGGRQQRTPPETVVVNPKPQNFLVLTMLTEKFKTFMDKALHVEFEQYYKWSRDRSAAAVGGEDYNPVKSASGAHRPHQERTATGMVKRSMAAAATAVHEDQAVDDDERDDDDDRAPLSEIGNEEDRQRSLPRPATPKVQRRKQMKRSGEIIDTVNGTRNCMSDSRDNGDENPVTETGTATRAGEGDERTGDNTRALEKMRTFAVSADVNDPASDAGCGQEPKNKGDKGNQGKEQRFLISKLPIFSSLTSSMNESIQRLFEYMAARKCAPGTDPGSGSPSSPENAEGEFQECVESLKCPSRSVRAKEAKDEAAQEELFCNYLCELVIKFSESEISTSIRRNHLIGQSRETALRPGQTVTMSEQANKTTKNVIDDQSGRRFASEGEVFLKMELICRGILSQRELSATATSSSSSPGPPATGSLGDIQMQFSENLLYFYNESAADRRNNNNKLVKQQQRQPHELQQQQQSPHNGRKTQRMPIVLNERGSDGASHADRQQSQENNTPLNSHTQNSQLGQRRRRKRAINPLTESTRFRSRADEAEVADADNDHDDSEGLSESLAAEAAASQTNFTTLRTMMTDGPAAAGDYDDQDDDERDMKDRAAGRQSEIATAASHYAKYSEYFSLFDYIVAMAVAEEEKGFDEDSGDDGGDNIQIDFIILDFQNIINPDNETVLGWRPFLIMQQNEQNRKTFTTHSILPGYHDWAVAPTTPPWNCGLLCAGVIALAVLILFSILMGGIISAITIRKYLLKQRLSKGPNKVVLSPADFVFPVDSRRVDEGIEAMLCCFLQQLQEFGGPEVEKPDVIKGSMGSLKNVGQATTQNKNNNTSGSGSLARHTNTVLDMRARYNGDLVQLKEILMLTGTELKTKAMDHLVMSHGLRHENINPLIGWLSDSNRTAMVFEYCSRGSLQDVLIMDDIKLDWSFRLSLLTDLVRGMRYLHSSPLRVHGGLTSRNCVVDARWVLKITDYGMPSFYDALGIVAPSKSAKELLWTAPEALRNTKGFPKCGTQMGDVYSFGIIMQEVVVRGEPYCMLSLSPEEIITKIKKPPPLIRPSVSKGAAPPEAINIMRQCWAEMPDMRPDFNTVYERFKQLNHGRKVNFVDTMFQMLEKYSNNLEELIRERTDQLDMERKKTEQLLNRMLPTTVAEKLKVGLGVEPEEFSEVTIYFSDIVGFTTIAAHCSPVQVVDLLNDLYTRFDATINAYNVYKVETIGDAYMVVSGLPSRIEDHAEQIATMALDLLHESGRFQVKHLPGVPLQLRIGLHSGPCCAGVVGLTMPRYCLFGDTVNTASRMESTGSSWRIHLSETTRGRLEKAGGYYIDPRGPIEIKGKGLMNTYWLLGKKGFDKPLPVPPPIGLDESLIRNSIQSSSQLIEQVSFDGDAAAAAAAVATVSAPESPRILSKPDSLEVKVEITPPPVITCTESAADQQQPQIMQYAQQSPVLLPSSESSPKLVAAAVASTSLDSTSGANTMSFSHQDFPPRASVSSASPQQRKMSEFSQDSLLNPNGFNRLAPSPGANSSRLFKKIEEMMDLSSPYNHYRCLSPSESNLVQCGNNILNMGSTLQNLAMLGGNLSVPSPAMTMMNTYQSLGRESSSSGGGGGDREERLSVNRSSGGFNTATSVSGSTGAGGGGGGGDGIPGSGRLLRRQFSLDKDDVNNNNNLSANSTTLSNNLGNSACLQAVIVGGSKSHKAGGGGGGVVEGGGGNCEKHSSLPSISGQTLINKLQSSSSSSTSNRHPPLYKHNSSSISQDLEKIEEIPVSPNHPFISLTFSGPHHQQQQQKEGGMYSQSSLTNSIPFIDGSSSCSSSVSTIHSSVTEKRTEGGGGDGGIDVGGSGKVGMTEQLDESSGRGNAMDKRTSSASDQSNADRREINLNVDTLLLLR